MLQISDFARKLSVGSGIGELMMDLGTGLEEARRTGKEISMLGGGNPAHIPELDRLFHERWQDLSKTPDKIASVLGDYTSPQGSDEFREILAVSLSSKLSYPFSKDHFAITQGSQTAFFLLFNSFAGLTSPTNPNKASKGKIQKILLPLVPEYIGYSDQGIFENMFTSLPPKVETTGQNRFRYMVDLDRFVDRLVQGDIGAVCLSRPTNPTGNVLPWKTIETIHKTTQAMNIPLIIDNAYGYPFPNILFQEPEIVWKPGMIHVLSLSKLGLPGTRTGIVIADPAIARIIGEMSAILNLAGGNLGTAMVGDWIQSGEIYRISDEIIRPYFKNQSSIVQSMIDDAWKDKLEYVIHDSLGALFLWLRFPGHKKSCRQIYESAKAQGVFVISGENFFPGLDENFCHQKECIRLTYSRNLSEVSRGIAILTEILT